MNVNYSKVNVRRQMFKGCVWLDMAVELRIHYCRDVADFIWCIFVQQERKFNL